MYKNKCISFYIYSKSRKNCMKSLEFVLNTIFLVLDTFQTLLLNIYIRMENLDQKNETTERKYLENT